MSIFHPDQTRIGRVDFDRVNDAALGALPNLLCHWLPGGKREGREYVVRNPNRSDNRPGSFRINTATGKWADFATGDAGGDVVSLAAFIFSLTQRDAALRLADMLGVDPESHS